jgi:hypothetical protein
MLPLLPSARPLAATLKLDDLVVLLLAVTCLAVIV